MAIGDTAAITWTLAGSGQAPITKRLTVTRKTSRSITLVDGAGEFTRGWTVKFADIGNEPAFANQLISVTPAH